MRTCPAASERWGAAQGEGRAAAFQLELMLGEALPPLLLAFKVPVPAHSTCPGLRALRPSTHGGSCHILLGRAAQDAFGNAVCMDRVPGVCLNVTTPAGAPWVDLFVAAAKVRRARDAPASCEHCMSGSCSQW